MHSQHNIFYNFQQTVSTYVEMKQTCHLCCDLHNCQTVGLLQAAQNDYGRKKQEI